MRVNVNFGLVTPGDLAFLFHLYQQTEEDAAFLSTDDQKETARRAILCVSRHMFEGDEPIEPKDAYRDLMLGAYGPDRWEWFEPIWAEYMTQVKDVAIPYFRAQMATGEAI